MKHKIKILLLASALIFLPMGKTLALEARPSSDDLKKMDTDNDGLSDYEENYIYHTDPVKADNDSDGFVDGEEVKFGFDPNKRGGDRLEKSIVVALADQSLSYKLGDYIIDTFKISSGVRNTTPTGEFEVIKKKPVVDYIGPGYSYPKTRWNLMFKTGARGNFYIHGAYWHNKFGQPMSHGCVNVSYDNMEGLYNWADTGTKVTIE